MTVYFNTPLSGSAIKYITGSTHTANLDFSASGITTDSGEASNELMFVCIIGEFHDGHRYIGEAIKRGTRLVLCSEAPTENYEGAVFLICDDTVQALKRLAAFFTAGVPCTNIAITGSFGKTATKDYCTAVLKSKYRAYSTLNNHNNKYGVIMTMLGIPDNIDYAIYEMGMNHLGEISELSLMVKPDIAIITSVGAAHIGLLGSRENIFKAKSEIIQGMTGGTLILPHEWRNNIDYNNIMTFSEKEPDADFYLENYDKGKYRIIINRSICIEYSSETYTAIQASTALKAAAVAYLCDMTPEEIEEALIFAQMPALRQEIKKTADMVFIMDHYNSSPETLNAAIDLLSETSAQRHIAVMGDMLELGECAEKYHYIAGKKCAEKKIDIMIVIGKYAESYRSGAVEGGMDKEKIFAYTPDMYTASAEQLCHELTAGDAVLFKGSHNSPVQDIVRLTYVMYQRREKCQEQS